jgi:hypothetical protein
MYFPYCREFVNFVLLWPIKVTYYSNMPFFQNYQSVLLKLFDLGTTVLFGSFRNFFFSKIWFLIYIASRLIGSRVIESAAYCNQKLLAHLHLSSTQNTSVNWIIRLLLSLEHEININLKRELVSNVQSVPTSVQNVVLDRILLQDISY